MNPKVSIALTTYNGERFLNKQLDSLRLQDYFIYEVIICDDCSSDHTVQLIQDYIKKYHLNNWKLICNEKNMGYKKNFFQAISQTTGDYIFLCDQDDIWHLDKVSQMMNVFMAHSQVECLNSFYSCIDAMDNHVETYSFIAEEYKHEKLNYIPFSYICFKNISMGCTMAFSKKIKDIYLTHSLCIAAHDWEINALAASVDGLYFYNEALIDYRIHNDNTTGIDKYSKQSLYSKRVHNAYEIVLFYQSLLHYSCIDNKKRNMLEKNAKVVQLRYELLKLKKTRNWFILLKDLSIYHQFISYKGIVLDFIESLKGD